MSERTRQKQGTSRRAMLGTAAAATAATTAAAGGIVLSTGGQAVGSQRPEPASGPPAGREVRGTFTFADRRGRQRFLMSARKPPVIIGGEVLPPEKRGGPEQATYLILNDGQGNEKGGIVGHDTGASVSLDYPTSQGATLQTMSQNGVGVAALSLAGMAPASGEPGVERVVLSGGNDGAALQLNDSKGRPRIVIGLGQDDRPMIKVLDASGAPVADLLADVPA